MVDPGVPVLQQLVIQWSKLYVCVCTHVPQLVWKSEDNL